MYKNKITQDVTIEKSGDSYCGYAPGRETFKLEVEVQARELDENGFVLNVSDVRYTAYYLEDNGPRGESGEQLAKLISDRLWDDRFTSMDVTIHSTGNSQLTFSRTAAPAVAAVPEQRAYTVDEVFPPETVQALNVAVARTQKRGQR